MPKTLKLAYFLLPALLANSVQALNSNPIENEKVTASTAIQPSLSREAQRESYRQLNLILNQFVAKSQQFPAQTQQVIEKLLADLEGYPLQDEARWAVMQAKINNDLVSKQEIDAFLKTYPQFAERNAIKDYQQRPFTQLFEQQKWAELISFANQTAPVGVLNQCRYFTAHTHLLDHTDAQAAKALAEQFDQFWLTGELLGSKGEVPTSLPKACDSVAKLWAEQGLRTDDRLRLQGVKFWQKNAKSALQHLADNYRNTAIAPWLTILNQLAKQPKNWKTFADNQTVDPINKSVVVDSFGAYVKTLSETGSEYDFAPYLALAEKWQLNDDELRSWKIAFISRLFDNPNTSFQQWRDQEILALKADNLTERRIRMALWQQTDLGVWLDTLSDSGKQKAEWRYWQAKNNPNKTVRQQQLAELARERGFYPLLAAHTLGQTYQFTEPALPPLTADEQASLAPLLDKVAEYRALGQMGNAKSAWRAGLKDAPLAKQLAWISQAAENQWFDLSVEGTIVAKAWDYISLRLPNAYSHWFDLARDLTSAEQRVSKTFAMAIARQESAWVTDARSSANALGLMQLLPTTAAQTAKNQGLPYQQERDLLNPLQNILLGTAHLNELNAKSPNNRILIASAYNAGSARVERWLKRANGKLAMDAFIASIPFLETRGYVQNVIAYDYYYQQLQGKQPLVAFYHAESQRSY